MKTKINIRVIQHWIQQIRDFNNLDLAEIEFHDDGAPIEVTPEQVDEWKFTGLSNKDFVDIELIKNDDSPKITQIFLTKE